MRINDKVKFPRRSDFENTKDYFEHISDSRDACEKRGYHRVAEEKEKGPMICYDCDMWFDKEFAKDNDVEYIVKDPLKQ